MNKIVLSISLLSFLAVGCTNSDTKEIPEYVNLSIPGDLPDLVYGDTSSITYRTYGWFDLQKLEGIGRATNKPFVYVRKLNNTIIVRTSEDINNPYILTDHGLYWHCSWEGDGRGDSIKIDRFVINKYIYELVQKRLSSGEVEKFLISTNTFDPLLTDDSTAFIKEFDLGASDEFDQNPEEHFLELLEQAKQILSRDDSSETNDTLHNNGPILWDLRIIPTPNPNRSPKYIETKMGKEYNYDSAPFGLYDENKDINRPYFMRRIK